MGIDPRSTVDLLGSGAIIPILLYSELNAVETVFVFRWSIGSSSRRLIKLGGSPAGSIGSVAGREGLQPASIDAVSATLRCPATVSSDAKGQWSRSRHLSSRSSWRLPACSGARRVEVRDRHPKLRPLQYLRHSGGRTINRVPPQSGGAQVCLVTSEPGPPSS